MACSLPDNMKDDYTINGIIPLQVNIRDDSINSIQQQINSNFTQQIFDKYLKMSSIKRQNYYGLTDTWLYQAIQKYPVKDKVVAIFGSANPWYEAVMIRNGVKKCIVLQYSDRPSFHQLLQYPKPWRSIKQQLDIGLSISSFQHDGLGRYGDPLNPNGDLRAMQFAKKIVKKDGLMFFSVPVGKDKICFNVHRIYGKVRMPMLLKSWQIVQTFGVQQNSFDRIDNTSNSTPYQPIFVLKNV